MSGPGLIADYLSVLSRQLPGTVVEELADGLGETYRRHLGLGLAPEAAARAAMAEFGDPQVIAAEFTRTHPARRAARRLLAVAAFGGRYRATARAGTAGCVGTVALDASVIALVAVIDPAITWAAATAMTASAIRVMLSARLLRPVLTVAL